MGQEQAQTESLPWGARIIPFNAIVAYQHLRGSNGCLGCKVLLGEESYLVQIPAQTREGVPYVGESAEFCSLAHAQAWLSTYAPRVRTEEDYPTQGNPTQVKGGNWLYAFRQIGTYPTHTERSGKWLVFLSAATIDRYWQIIKGAVERGELGDSAKVATGEMPRQRDGHAYVICVYTYDHTDREDVLRTRQRLRELGIRRPIDYKSDEDTGFLRYGANYAPLYHE
jgi:hypothetical protein